VKPLSSLLAFVTAGFLVASPLAAQQPPPGIVWQRPFGEATFHDIRRLPDGGFIAVGETASNVFPVTAGCFQATFAGVRDGVVVRVDASGGVVYATYFGGAGDDIINGVGITPSGEAFFVGTTRSSDLPRGVNTFAALRGVQDGFAAMLDAAGATLLYRGYLGGRFMEAARAVALAPNGQFVMCGWTNSDDFFGLRSASGSRDAFALRILPDSTGPWIVKLVGGSSSDEATDVGIQPDP